MVKKKKHAHAYTPYYVRKLKAQCLLQPSFQFVSRETQTCWNLWRPNLNLPQILFSANIYSHVYTHTHTPARRHTPSLTPLQNSVFENR